MITDRSKLDAVEREIKFRERVYGRQVTANKMTQAWADYQIKIFEEIAADYRAKVEGEKLL